MAKGKMKRCPAAPPGPSLLLALPDDVLRTILSLSRPPASHWDGKAIPQWEWAGVLSRTCRRFRYAVVDLNLNLAPESFDSSDLYFESTRDRMVSEDMITGGTFEREQPFKRVMMWQDRVPRLLRSFREYPWMGQRLRELHIDNSCFELDMDILEAYGTDDDNEPITSIVAALHSLLTTMNVLPNLEWLDICAPMCTANEYYTDCNLMDADTLLKMPFCLPSVTNLTLVGCFPIYEPFSLRQLRKFLRAFAKPLQGLTLGQVRWMTDDHVQVIADQLGGDLSTLELLDCNYVDRYDGYHYTTYGLGPRAVEAIAEKCSHLESVSLTRPGRILLGAGGGICPILRSNAALQQVNLSGYRHLDDGIVNLLCDLPHLRTLRVHDCRWFDGQALERLVRAQHQRSREDGKIVLNTLGVLHSKATFDSMATFLEHNPTGRLEMGVMAKDFKYYYFDGKWAHLAARFPEAVFAFVPEQSAFGSVFNPSFSNDGGPSYTIRRWKPPS